MKKNILLLSVILIVGAMLISCNQNKKTNPENESKFSKLTGPYLGQKPPGMTPEIFVPGLLSAGRGEFKITFSPDGKEFCYNFSSPAAQWIVEPTGLFKKSFMMYSHMENGCWTEPEEFSFNPDLEKYYPFFSPDGKRLYFNEIKTGAPRKLYVERQNGAWREPKEIELTGGFQNKGLFISIAGNGNLYFGMSPDGENTFIYMSRNENGLYSIPEKLSNVVNEAGGAHHPYIAPDESYIIFDYPKSKNGSGEEDLYISFRDQNGKWMEPQNMGQEINTVYRDKRAFVSFDGKYLFFISNRINPEIPKGPLTLKQVQRLMSVPANSFQHIYWVDAKIIEELKPDHLK
ncbi:TolB family protein [candidate division KSB1 bacterium]